jgi:hypothetical protein
LRVHGDAPPRAGVPPNAGCSTPRGEGRVGGDASPSDAAAAKKSALREKALADVGVQAMLEVFPAEIRDVEEM